ncbi:hypothetical protein GYA49_04825 [Candidatus Beckwithbacteria bacterium]|nr:hypothetical protein [Candidatus Beckwithbacteria bacterium]
MTKVKIPPVHLFFVRIFFKVINFNIKKIGLQGTFQKLAIISCSKFDVIFESPEVKKILIEKPVILVSNHPHEFDPFVLLAGLPKRKKLFMIAGSDFMAINVYLNKYLIPVYVYHHTDLRIKQKRRIRYMRKYLIPNKFTIEEAHKRNIKSITLASTKIRQGALVAIFPAGPLNKSWYSGVGYLIKQAKNKDLQVVQAYINGTSDLDYLRFLPLVGLILPKVKLHFSLYRKSQSLIKKEPKQIAKTLEADYNKWIKTLH